MGGQDELMASVRAKVEEEDVKKEGSSTTSSKNFPQKSASREEKASFDEV